MNTHLPRVILQFSHILGRCCLIAAAIVIYTTSNIIHYVRGLDRRGQIRLGLAAIGFFVTVIVFIAIKDGGCLQAFIRGIGFAFVTIVILTAWLEFFGFEIIASRDELDWDDK